MGKLIYEQIVTDRLRLRNIQKEDYIAHYEFLKDKDNFPYADYKTASCMEDVEEHFDRMMRDNLKSSLFWIIAEKVSGRAIGTMSAWNVDFDRNSIEFGYSIYPVFRGKGYMREVLKAMIDFCTIKLGFSVIDIWTDTDNLPSRKLAESLGFAFVGYEEERAKYSPGNIKYAKYVLEV